MKYAAVLLVLVLLAIAVPLAVVGGEMATCQWCFSSGPSMIFAFCAAILTMALTFQLTARIWTTVHPGGGRSVGNAPRLFKPPQPF